MRFTTKECNAVDLFCGAGGMSLGLQMAGYNINMGLDFVKDCEDTHNINFPDVPFICGDITNVKGSEILNKIGLKKGELTLVSGGPPCQGFSIVGKRDPSDKRNQLIFEFARVVKDKKPKKFIMENVSRLKSVNNGRTIKSFKSKLEKEGYSVKCDIHNALDFGVPQSRKRVICIGERKK